MTQTERDIMIIQDGGWDSHLHKKKTSLFGSLMMDASWIIVVKDPGK